jgi:hypothetical protein
VSSKNGCSTIVLLSIRLFGRLCSCTNMGQIYSSYYFREIKKNSSGQHVPDPSKVSVFKSLLFEVSGRGVLLISK